MATKVIMPQLGESVVEGTVTRWLKQEGETIEEMELLLEVETDKVTTEIPSPAAGTVLRLAVPEGQTVRAGTVIAWIGAAGETPPGENGGEPNNRAPEVAEPGAGPAKAAIQESAAAPAATTPSAPDRRDLGFISPVVARMAQEHQLDLSKITGTGERGRITKKDVLAYLENSSAQAEAQQPAPWETPADGDLFRPTEMVFAKAAQPSAPPAQSAPRTAEHTAPAQPQAAPAGQVVPLSSMRRKIAEHMSASKRISPHVTTVMEADLHRVVAHYTANKALFQRDGARLTYTAYFTAAAAQALRAFPLVNSSWSEEGIVLHPQVNIGMAVSLGEDGLIVPILRSADSLSLIGLARVIEDMAGRARSRSLQAADVQGGTFTITNHGITGSLFATPIISQPQCAILGVGAIQKRVVVTNEDAIAIRPMCYLSLTFDHRILDGASADGFLARVVQVLQEWPAA